MDIDQDVYYKCTTCSQSFMEENTFFEHAHTYHHTMLVTEGFNTSEEAETTEVNYRCTGCCACFSCLEGFLVHIRQNHCKLLLCTGSHADIAKVEDPSLNACDTEESEAGDDTESSLILLQEVVSETCETDANISSCNAYVSNNSERVGSELVQVNEFQDGEKINFYVIEELSPRTLQKSHCFIENDHLMNKPLNETGNLAEYSKSPQSVVVSQTCVDEPVLCTVTSAFAVPDKHSRPTEASEMKQGVQKLRYQCKVCSKTFGTKSHVNMHEKTHTGIKPYTCSFCGRCFHRKDHLINHIRIHTGEKPFQCDICCKAFRQQANLNMHKASCGIFTKT